MNTLHSTINIDFNILSEISSISDKHRVKTSHLVKTLISQTIHFLKSDGISGLCEYQAHLPDNGWKCFHYCLNELEADLYANARAKHKLSISKMVLIGFLFFLDEALKILKGDCGNTDMVIYSYTYYFISLAKSLIKNTKNRKIQQLQIE